MYYILLISSTKSFPKNSLASGENIFLNFSLYLSPVPPCTVLEFTESQPMPNDLKNTFPNNFLNNFPEFQMRWFPFFPPALLPPLPFYPPGGVLGNCKNHLIEGRLPIQKECPPSQGICHWNLLPNSWPFCRTSLAVVWFSHPWKKTADKSFFYKNKRNCFKIYRLTLWNVTL